MSYNIANVSLQAVVHNFHEQVHNLASQVTQQRAELGQMKLQIKTLSRTDQVILMMQCCQSVGFCLNTPDLLLSLRIVGVMTLLVGFSVKPWRHISDCMRTVAQGWRKLFLLFLMAMPILSDYSHPGLNKTKLRNSLSVDTLNSLLTI